MVHMGVIATIISGRHAAWHGTLGSWTTLIQYLCDVINRDNRSACTCTKREAIFDGPENWIQGTQPSQT